MYMYINTLYRSFIYTVPVDFMLRDDHRIEFNIQMSCIFTKCTVYTSSRNLSV